MIPIKALITAHPSFVCQESELVLWARQIQVEFLVARRQDPSRGPGQLGTLPTPGI
jgi:hypothetical protein